KLVDDLLCEPAPIARGVVLVAAESAQGLPARVHEDDRRVARDPVLRRELVVLGLQVRGEGLVTGEVELEKNDVLRRPGPELVGVEVLAMATSRPRLGGGGSWQPGTAGAIPLSARPPAFPGASRLA